MPSWSRDPKLEPPERAANLCRLRSAMACPNEGVVCFCCRGHSKPDHVLKGCDGLLPCSMLCTRLYQGVERLSAPSTRETNQKTTNGPRNPFSPVTAGLPAQARGRTKVLHSKPKRCRPTKTAMASCHLQIPREPAPFSAMGTEAHHRASRRIAGSGPGGMGVHEERGRGMSS